MARYVALLVHWFGGDDDRPRTTLIPEGSFTADELLLMDKAHGFCWDGSRYHRGGVYKTKEELEPVLELVETAHERPGAIAFELKTIELPPGSVVSRFCQLYYV